MSTVATLTLRALHRPGAQLAGGSYITERHSLDFVVDGRSLFEALRGDYASCLGWGDPAWEALVIDKLLGATAPDLPPDRVALYVCPECGDLGCGAVTVAIARDGDALVWRDFGYQNDYSDELELDRYEHLGPFRFLFRDYEVTLRGVRDRQSEQSS